MSDLTLSQALILEEQEIAEIDAELPVVERRLEQLHRRRSEHEATAETLRGLLQQHSGMAGRADPFLTMSRTEAVEVMLRESPETMTPKELTTEAQRRGRDDSYEAINAALAHLSRTDRAHAPRRGQWVVGPDQSTNPIAYREDDDAEDLLTSIGEG